MINGADYMNWRDVTAAGGGGTLTTSAYDTSEIGAMANSKKEIEKDVSFQQMMKKNIKYYLYQLVQSNAMNGISSTTDCKNMVSECTDRRRGSTCSTYDPVPDHDDPENC